MGDVLGFGTMRDLSKPGDRRRQVEEMRAAEARLENLLQHQHLHREQLRRQGAADALFGRGDMIISRGD